jgi:hypothetical protein
LFGVMLDQFGGTALLAAWALSFGTCGLACLAGAPPPFSCLGMSGIGEFVRQSGPPQFVARFLRRGGETGTGRSR